jgi:homocysteine S-methyltransferase
MMKDYSGITLFRFYGMLLAIFCLSGTAVFAQDKNDKQYKKRDFCSNNNYSYNDKVSYKETREMTMNAVHNLLIITGDPPKMGPFPDATAVFDIDSIGLTNMVNKLNHGLDLGNNPIGCPTAFSIGVGVNPGAINMDEEIRRFEWKVEAGAEYAITQPVYDTKQLRDFLKRIEHCKVPIVAGIFPLVSIRNAEFMHNEVPGVVVTQDILHRMRVASEKSKEDARDEGIKIARESLTEVQDLIQGVQVSAPFGNVKYALQVFDVLPQFVQSKEVSAVS